MRPTARQLLKENDLPALLVSNPVNVRYLTGVPADDELLLVLPKGYILFCSVLETEAIRASKPKHVTVRSSALIESTMKKVPLCGFEEDHVTVGRLKRWKKEDQKTKYVGTRGAVESFRRTKDAGELKAILKANAITEDILERIPSLLKPGITELGVAFIIECWAREQGAQKMGFDTIVAFGTHTSRPHHRPTTKKLKKGDLVQIDMGLVIDGYTSDRSAVYFTGKPTAQQKKVLEALQEAKEAGIDAIAPGVPCSEPDRVARNTLKKHGLAKYFIHSLGHGVGLDIHEGVSLSKRSKQTLLEHEVVTVEPGVYFEGKWGMRLEDMVVVQ
jgi:Xaa-Pro aminopeptidase